MLMTFGTHEGNSVELLMLKRPDYVKYVTDQSVLTGPLAAVGEHMNRLINIFDEKPFIGESCSSKECTNPASKFTVYGDNLGPLWWCDSCNPYQFGAPEGNLQAPIGYHHALMHVFFYCKGRKSDYKDLITKIAEAKGLPKRVGEEQAQDFFRG